MLSVKNSVKEWKAIPGRLVSDRKDMEDWIEDLEVQFGVVVVSRRSWFSLTGGDLGVRMAEMDYGGLERFQIQLDEGLDFICGRKQDREEDWLWGFSFPASPGNLPCRAGNLCLLLSRSPCTHSLLCPLHIIPCSSSCTFRPPTVEGVGGWGKRERKRVGKGVGQQQRQKLAWSWGLSPAAAAALQSKGAGEAAAARARSGPAPAPSGAGSCHGWGDLSSGHGQSASARFARSGAASDPRREGAAWGSTRTTELSVGHLHLKPRSPASGAAALTTSAPPTPPQTSPAGRFPQPARPAPPLLRGGNSPHRQRAAALSAALGQRQGALPRLAPAAIFWGGRQGGEWPRARAGALWGDGVGCGFGWKIFQTADSKSD